MDYQVIYISKKKEQVQMLHLKELICVLGIFVTISIMVCLDLILLSLNKYSQRVNSKILTDVIL